ncbi:hypothetical protein TeGR_g11451, partial [Tetraparma gracilis]
PLFALSGGASPPPLLTPKRAALSALALALLLLAPNLRAGWRALPPLRPLLAARLAPVLGLGPVAGPLTFFLGYSLWVAAGLSTTPVELISAFTFPLPAAAAANVGGKIAGSCLAFLFSRHLVARPTPEISAGPLTTRRLTLLASRQPLRTTVLIRLSVLPDLLKNYLLSTLPISFPLFLLGTTLHAAPYSLLWSLLGSQMSDVSAPVKVTGWLKVAVTVGMLGGVVGAPLVIAREMEKVDRKR